MSEVRLYPMMGKLAKVRRWVSIRAVEGRVVWTLATAAFTRASVWNISTFQLKNRSTSAEPRLVTERTLSNPSTLFTANSIGLVMVTIIWSMGITPLSTPTMMRGKSVSGNTATGRVNPRYTPTDANVMIRKIIDLEWRANQYDSARSIEATTGGVRVEVGL